MHGGFAMYVGIVQRFRRGLTRRFRVLARRRVAVATLLFIGCVLLLLLALSGVRRWNDSAYDDIRSAAEAYDAPNSWELVEVRISGSKRLIIWSSDTRNAVLVFTTDENGEVACDQAEGSLTAFTGLASGSIRRSPPGPAAFCQVGMYGEFEGITSAFIDVSREYLGDGQYSELVDEIIVVLKEPVNE